METHGLDDGNDESAIIEIKFAPNGSNGDMPVKNDKEEKQHADGKPVDTNARSVEATGNVKPTKKIPKSSTLPQLDGSGSPPSLNAPPNSPLITPRTSLESLPVWSTPRHYINSRVLEGLLAEFQVPPDAPEAQMLRAANLGVEGEEDCTDEDVMEAVSRTASFIRRLEMGIV